MRKTILILPLFFLATHIFGQEKLLLKKFKYRVNNYRQIDFSLNGGSSLVDADLTSGDYENKGSSGNLAAGFYLIKSTDKILLNMSGNAELRFNSGKTDQHGSNSKSKGFSGSSQFAVTNKWFRKNLFAELGTDLFIHGQRSKYSSSIPVTSGKYEQDEYSVAFKLGVGKGRLENVTDMQNALWLYKTLQDEGILSRSLNNDELDELGRTITRAKNVRVLDFRRRTRYMLETTDRFFQQKDVLATDGIRYFSSLNDVLFFAVNNYRLSGTELYLRIIPSTTKTNDNDINNVAATKRETRIVNKSVLLTAGIGWYMPVNLRHQNNYGASLRLNYGSLGDESRYFTSGTPSTRFETNTITREVAVDLFFQHAIYPNTRTEISFDLNSEAGYRQIDSSGGFSGTANARVWANYFISYRTRLTFSAGANYLIESDRYGVYSQPVSMPDFLRLYINAGLLVSL